MCSIRGGGGGVWKQQGLHSSPNPARSQATLTKSHRGGFEHNPAWNVMRAAGVFSSWHGWAFRVSCGSYIQSKQRRETAAIPSLTFVKGFCFLRWQPCKSSPIAQGCVHMRVALPITRGKKGEDGSSADNFLCKWLKRFLTKHYDLLRVDPKILLGLQSYEPACKSFLLQGTADIPQNKPQTVFLFVMWSKWEVVQMVKPKRSLVH